MQIPLMNLDGLLLNQDKILAVVILFNKELSSFE